MNEIIVNSSLNQTRVAMLEDGELVELYIERENSKRTVGNIYKGRITNVLPGMQAAFVDIGLEKNAFLFVKDAVPVEMSGNRDVSIRDVVKNGQEIVVQVTKEPIGTKGARVTTHITLPGRYLVLMPDVDYIGISRRINNEDERERLRKLLEGLKPNNMGVIVRTAGEGKEEKELKEDLKFLLKLWQKIDKEKNLGFAPRTIYRDLDLIHRTIRDMFTSSIHKLTINDQEKYKSILDLVELIAPHLKSRVEYFEIDMDIFDYYNLEKMINNAIARKVWLKSGGYLIIDQTEALTVIDVNTGKYVGSIDLEDTVLKTNKEAAEKIAKQLRLRDIGGIIIVDFIDMNNDDAEREVLDVLEKALERDKTKTNVLGITQLGLLEMTRKKIRGRIGSIMQKKCPYCEGTGKVLSEYTVIQNIEREVKRIAVHTNAEAVWIEVAPLIEEFLKTDKNRFIKELEEVSHVKIFIQGVDHIHANDINVKSMGKLDKIRRLLEENK
ncbi:Rne/Rng family ribonuclease [Crassaminicella profunda]|uniref:Rne/Rng family ribonuclease n=1 Tax=Crassaminicella profunda TaxID=1286698 RepID=UPI001CA6BFE7|nr:Rne/Rng family ribonuclease [Crassaminicella profunda]QZY56614.1 Rne/Rng family ribonuclease [Crassaminicella profunda]